MPIERLKKKTREELLWPYLLKLLLIEPAYAYELRKKVNENFGWKPPLTTSYTVLYRLERKEYITGTWEKEKGRPRKYYQITDKGEDLLKEGRSYFKDLQEKLFEDLDQLI
ncbi:PadR family transcriptional regulator [candidate division MSBL1 archaeon SCGC-AAA259A05]|uniref:PadR family transcriptional regulator n=1 Tax=candidate division MSBL1 archaeon SCGC-AAA259A05 TaxID=1698259 RepID=A0A133U492_9EURY|nr:PadR family transcriptional regulator [candidate division MSBL1 archaeon SCGC-AAA259A05]